MTEVDFDKFKEMLMEMDADANGNINYSEFLILLTEKQRLLSKENLKITFDTLDFDSSGSLSLAELRRAFEFNGNKKTDLFWVKFMKEVDTNGDGEISFDEFEAAMRALIASK